MSPDSVRHSVITSLLMPTLSGSKDQFGKTDVPPLPLSFDTVNHGQPITSLMPIFSLPIELLHSVTPYLSQSDLASLALVDRDCRQLARSIQFASVHFDYGNAALGLATQLLREAAEGNSLSCDRQYRIRLLLGSCIRRITVATNPGRLHHRHGLSLERLVELHEAGQDDEETQLLETATCGYENYITSIMLAVKFAMPNVEFVDWQERYLTPEIINALAVAPSLRHLKMVHIAIHHEFEVPAHPAHFSKLETLELEFFWRIEIDVKNSTSPLIISIIRQAARTLRTLKWSGYLDRDGVDFADGSILIACMPLDATIPLRSLSLAPARGQNADFLATRGYIPSLEELHLTHWDTKDISTLSFLRANSQLRTFTASSPLPPLFLETHLLHDLSYTFHYLTTLSLIWDDTEISESSLQAIGSIITLRKLWISAGEQFGWRHSWKINHNALLKAFKRLLNLKCLAYSRDSYILDASLRLRNGDLIFRLDEYYHTFVLPGYGRYDTYLQPDEIERMETGTELETNELERVAWERWHREKIMGIANRYVDTLPSLKWCYFGQLPMKVAIEEKQKNRRKRNKQITEKQRVAVMESDERDDCWTLLRRMWGILV